jgi:peptidoglycan/LPS O-acetylase OafA/YrhL
MSSPASTPPGSEARPKRFDYKPELDGMRALAVLSVMSYHAFMTASGASRFRGGFLGVDVFFGLSGYLITTLLVREWDALNRIRLGYFYARRGLRLLPALFTALVFGAIVVELLPHPTRRPYWLTVIVVSVYVANWFLARGFLLTPLGHTWSLSIEEQYYLLWCPTLILLLRFVRSRRAIAAFAFSVAIFIAVFRYAVFRSGHIGFAMVSTVTRPDSVLIGSALALVLSDSPRFLKALLSRREIAVLCVLLIGASVLKLPPNSRRLHMGGLFAFNLCVAFVIGHLAVTPASPLRRLLTVQPLPAIGRISYGMYLYHVPMLFLLFHGGQPSGALKIAALYVLTIVMATVSYFTIEAWALRYRSRFGSVSRVPVDVESARR